MSDLKLFRIDDGVATELDGSHALLEKHLQKVVEANMEILLEVRFLATEYGTGKRHNGRIDTLGIDENGSPVIVEYKRTRNDSVISQGLFYLNWLMDHRAEFEQLVRGSDHSDLAGSIDWSTPRLICVATDFSRYDRLAVEEIGKAIDLITYRDFGGDLLSLTLVHSNATESTTSAARRTSAARSAGANPARDAADESSDLEAGDVSSAREARANPGLDQRLAQAAPRLLELFDTVVEHCEELGDDVSKKTLKHYVSFRRLRRFISINLYPASQQLLIHMKLDPDTVELREGFTRDVSNLGHTGIGNLEVRVTDPDQLETVYALIQRAYENA